MKRTRERRPDLLAQNRPVTVAYFSPTEGTRKAAELLAMGLTQNPRYLDLTRRKFRKQIRNFQEQELLVAAAPVYGGQLPRVEEGLFTNLRGNHTPCVLMAAYGNRHYDDTLAQMKEILTRRGFVCIGAIAPVIPHIYSDRLGAGRPNEKDREVFRRFSVLIKKRIQEAEGQGFAEVILPGNPNPEPRDMKPVEKSFQRENCTNCQACVQKCPVNAISRETLEISPEKCIGCMRCVRVCKAKARDFDASQVRQYLESNYSEPREIECF